MLLFFFIPEKYKISGNFFHFLSTIFRNSQINNMSEETRAETVHSHKVCKISARQIKVKFSSIRFKKVKLV